KVDHGNVVVDHQQPPSRCRTHLLLVTSVTATRTMTRTEESAQESRSAAWRSRSRERLRSHRGLTRVPKNFFIADERFFRPALGRTLVCRRFRAPDAGTGTA